MMSSAVSPPPTSPARWFSFRRVLKVLVPLLVVVGAGYGYVYWKYAAEEAALSVPPFGIYLKQTFDYPAELDQSYFADADGDMVADPPSDSSKLIDPPVLVFSVLGSDIVAEQASWKDFLAHLEKTTGKKVKLEHRPYITQEDFLKLRDGTDVQILQLNTGAVVPAVTLGGFVPLAVPAAADGSFGYELEFIASPKGSIQKLEDLAGKSIPFTDKRVALGNTRSFSGYKAPMALLYDKYKLLPHRDYQPLYAGTTTDLIVGVRDQRYALAPVASDFLQRRVAEDPSEAREQRKIAADQYNAIPTGQKYPPACVGVVHNLNKNLRDNIEKAFVGYQFKGTSMEKEYAPANQVQFVKVDYKKDWEPVRKVDEQLRKLCEVKP
jgi:phosphonate transport system substrate-binding protein